MAVLAVCLRLLTHDRLRGSVDDVRWKHARALVEVARPLTANSSVSSGNTELVANGAEGDVARPQTRYARTRDGVHVAYQVLGEGPLSLLLVTEGFIPIDSMDSEPTLAHCLRRLRTFTRVIRFNRRGIGLSDPVAPTSPPTLEDWVDDCMAVLDAAGCQQAAIMGNADAALVALLAAAIHPTRVSAVVVINAFPRYCAAPDFPFGHAPAFVEEITASATRPEGGGEGFDLLSLLAPSVAGDKRFRDWWDHAGRHGASPATAQAFRRVIEGSDIRAVLPSIHVPSLVLQRENNPLHPVEFGRYLAEHISGARYVELPGDDMLWWIDAEVLLDEIEDFLTGRRASTNPDRVLQTVLFTDIVDSTALAVRLGDRRWRQMLDEYESMVTSLVEGLGGRVIKETGDGTLAAFDGPVRAVQCARSIRSEVAQLGMKVRAGLHTGEVEIRGDDIAGVTVHVAARIQAAAQPGEILLSDAVVDLTAGTTVDLVDRGEHQLKGVPGRWRLFAVGTT